jgi:hypothetical protein
MKLFLFISFLLITLAGCDYRSREEAIRKKEAALNEKEQQLLLKEKSLQLKEQELLQKQKVIDSTSAADTTARYNPNLIGLWNVQMTCTETTCAGSAVGDTKTETWEISYQDKNLIARAMVNDELVRVYSGIFTGNTIELVDVHEAGTPPGTKMIVRLTITDDSKLEGQRSIERPGENCRIVYTLVMDKK